MSIRSAPFVVEEFYHIYNRGNSKQAIFHDNADMVRFQNLLFILNKPERVEIRNTRYNKKTTVGTQGVTTNGGKTYVYGGLASEGTSVTEPKVLENTKLVAIGSYCLIPNHFHILLTPVVDGGVSKFMQKLTTAYSMYYNKKYAHTGGLFEGKFKAKHITDDRYLKYLFSYINLNPVKLIDPSWKQYGIKDINKTFAFLETYTYSSYPDLVFYKNTSKQRSEADVLSLEYFPEYFPTGQAFKNEILVWFRYRDSF